MYRVAAHMGRLICAVGTICAFGLTACAPVRESRVASVPDRIAGEISFPGFDGVSLRGVLQRPQGQPATAKLPAVVFQHGCGGPGANGRLSARHQAAMDWAVARGYIALHVDSLSPRGEKEICTQRYGGRNVTQKERVNDAYAALQFLAQRPDVDPQRIALWGWSHGGSSVLNALKAPAHPNVQSRFAFGISFYPGCTLHARNASQYLPLAPIYVFIGAQDDWTPAAPCEAWGREMKHRDQPVAVHLYPNAYHGFDDPSPTARVRLRTDVPNGVNPGKGVHVGPNPAARELAMQEIERIFQQRFAYRSP